jgi:hypothetical protein
MAQTLGIIDLVWNGTKIQVEKGATFKPGGIKNNSVIAGRQVHQSQEYIASEVKGTTVLMAGQSLLALIATTAGELQVVCDTGQTYVMNDAFLVDRPDVTAGEGGKVNLTWNAGEPQELLS